MNILSTARHGAWLALLLGMAACQAAPSAAELRQLQQLDASLQELNRRSAQDARATVAGLQENVARNMMQRQDVAVLTQAKRVQGQADSLSRYLHGLRQQLLPAGSAQLAAHEPVETVLLGPRGAADTLQGRLDRYSRYIQQLVPGQGRLLAVDAKDDPRIREAVGHDLDDWRFGELYFRGASVAEALVTLGQKEAEVRRLEQDALGQLSMRVGSGCGFDRIGPFAMPKAGQVEEGETYEATLLLTTSARQMRGLTMQANGRDVPVGPDGRGRVELPVPADAPAGPAFWEATIRGTYRGQDTTFRLRVPYLVQRR
jgi:hypothetical protein